MYLQTSNQLEMHRKSGRQSTWNLRLYCIVPVQLMHHGGLSVSPHHHLLLLQLFRHLRQTQWHMWVTFMQGWHEARGRVLLKTRAYIFGRGSGNLNPGLGEEGAGAQHEDNVDNSMNRIIQNWTEWLWRRKVVAETAHWVGTSWSTTCGVLDKNRKKDVFVTSIAEPDSFCHVTVSNTMTRTW